jgi:hypothetical protein
VVIIIIIISYISVVVERNGKTRKRENPCVERVREGGCQPSLRYNKKKSSTMRPM